MSTKITIEKKISIGKTFDLTPFKINQVLHEEDLNLSSEVRFQVVVKIVRKEKNFHIFEFTVLNIGSRTVDVNLFELKSGYGSRRKSLTTRSRMTKASGICLADFIIDYDNHECSIEMGFRLEISSNFIQAPLARS